MREVDVPKILEKIKMFAFKKKFPFNDYIFFVSQGKFYIKKTEMLALFSFL